MNPCHHSPTRPARQRYEHLPGGVAPVGQVVARRRRRVVPLPLDGVVHALLPAVAQLVQLDVVLDEGVGEQTEHQQHERLGRAVQHRAHAAHRHHQHLAARGEAELDRRVTRAGVRRTELSFSPSVIF